MLAQPSPLLTRPGNNQSSNLLDDEHLACLTHKMGPVPGGAVLLRHGGVPDQRPPGVTLHGHQVSNEEQVRWSKPCKHPSLQHGVCPSLSSALLAPVTLQTSLFRHCIQTGQRIFSEWLGQHTSPWLGQTPDLYHWETYCKSSSPRSCMKLEINPELIYITYLWCVTQYLTSVPNRLWPYLV